MNVWILTKRATARSLIFSQPKLTIMKLFLAILAILPMFIVEPLLQGWALRKLWAWFVVTKFNLPVLSIPEAIGLALVVSYLTHQTINCQKEEDDNGLASKLAKSCGTVIFKPVFAVAFGAIIKSWI